MTTMTAQLSLQLILDDGASLEVPATFMYDTDDPYAVTTTFRSRTGNVSWVFGRDLLQEGARRAVGEGDITIWPTTSDTGGFVWLLFLTPSGTALLQAAQPEVTAFLAAAYDLVSGGFERVSDDLDMELAHLIASKPNTH